VRAADQNDAHGLAVAHVDTWRATYVEIMPADFLAGLSVSAKESTWRESLKAPQPGVHCWVAELADRIVGFVSFGPSRDKDGEGVAEIYAMYATPDVWGTGVGRAMMERATGLLRDAGFEMGTLWVLANNPRARRFYERAGWQPDGATKDEEVAGRSLHKLRYRTQLKLFGFYGATTPGNR